jgi:hypothetical protein
MRYVFEGNVAVWFVPTVASVAAPTAAEINAGTNLTAFFTKDGFDSGINDSQVSVAGLDTDFDAEIQGSWAAKPKVTLFRDDTTDTAWTTLPRKASGYFVVRPIGGPTAVAAIGNKVEVYPVQTGQRQLNNTAENEKKKFTVQCACTAAPNLAATVA